MGKLNFRAAAFSGIMGGAVYLATAEIDNRMTGINEDDLALLGWPLVRDKRYVRLAGVPVHFVNSIAIAAVYGLVRNVIPGPKPLRGLAFALTEATLLFPLAALEHHHPGIRSGAIDRYFTLNSYLLSLPRHATYGLTMGLLYDRLADSRG